MFLYMPDYSSENVNTFRYSVFKLLKDRTCFKGVKNKTAMLSILHQILCNLRSEFKDQMTCSVIFQIIYVKHGKSQVILEDHLYAKVLGKTWFP